MRVTVDGVEYVTPKEAVSLLGIPASTVYKWCATGKVVLLGDDRMPFGLATKYLIRWDSLVKRHRKVYLE